HEVAGFERPRAAERAEHERAPLLRAAGGGESRVERLGLAEREPAHRPRRKERAGEVAEVAVAHVRLAERRGVEPRDLEERVPHDRPPDARGARVVAREDVAGEEAG